MHTDRLFSVLSSTARRLPAGVLYAVADLTAAIAFHLCRSRREAALANFEALAETAGAGADAPARSRALAREAFGSHHRLALEFLRAAALQSEGAGTPVSFEGTARLASALARGRGVILATVHTGNWQVAGCAHEDFVTGAHTVAGTQFHRRLSDEVRRVEERSGVRVHEPRRAASGLAAALRRGEIVLLHLDGGFVGRGLPARVFGRDVRLARGALVLARRTGAPVLPAAMRRTGPFRFRVEFGEPLPIAACADAEAAAVLAREIERQVLEAPGQWALFRDLAADASPKRPSRTPRRGPRGSERGAARAVRPGLRIALVTQSYYPVLGGVSEHVHSLAEALMRRGHDVTIIAPRWRAGVRIDGGRGGREDSGRPTPAGRMSRARVVHLGRGLTVPFHGAHSQVAVGWRLGAGMQRALDFGRFDVVHVHSPLVPTLPLLALRRRTARIVGTFHTAGDARPYRAAIPLLRRFTRTLGAGIAVSEPAHAFARRFYDGPLSIIPNGVDLERFHPNGGSPREGPMRLLCVGRLEPRAPGRAMLVLVGGGPLDRSLRARAARVGPGRVRFEGAVAPGSLPSVYRDCDLFIAPAVRNESFGIVLLEAMASGLPVVASDIPGYRAVVGGAGALFAPGDAAALASAVERLLDDRSERLRLSAAGLERAGEHRWSDIAARVEELYANALMRADR
jgi:phosphatidylinositol alpha-mannosyltransferase